MKDWTPDRLHKLRLALFNGVTQRSLAQLVGVSTRSVSRWESGFPPWPSVAQKLDILESGWGAASPERRQRALFLFKDGAYDSAFLVLWNSVIPEVT